jgi:hypothetical protein
MNSFAPDLIARVWSAGSIEPLNTTTGIPRGLHRFKSSTPVVRQKSIRSEIRKIRDFRTYLWTVFKGSPRRCYEHVA